MTQEPKPPENPEKGFNYMGLLPWALSVLVACLWSLISMWFGIQTLTKNVTDLQMTVNTGNTSVSVLSSQIELAKFRLGTIEADVQRLNKSILDNQRSSK